MIGGRLLALFEGPAGLEPWAPPETPAPLHALLPWRAFDERSELYVNAGSVGFVVELPPFAGIDGETLGALSSTLYHGQGWRVAAERYVQLPAWLGCLPMVPAGGLDADLARLGRMKTLLTSSEVNLAPVHGEWRASRRRPRARPRSFSSGAAATGGARRTRSATRASTVRRRAPPPRGSTDGGGEHAGVDRL